MPEFYNDQRSSTADNLLLGRVHLYVAGVLMPVSSVTVTSAAGMVPQASFTTATDPRLFDMGRMDRVPVQIFVKETMAGSDEYILLFEGFIVSRSYVNTALQQVLSYTAVAYMDVLEDARIQFLTSIDDAYMASAAGASDKQRNISALGGLAYPSCLYRKGLGLGGSSDIIESPTQFLENIYGFIGSGGPAGLPAQPGAPAELAASPSAGSLNDSALAAWHHKWAAEIKLMQRYEKLPYFDYPVTETTATGSKVQVSMSADGARATCFPMLAGLEKEEALSMLVQGGMAGSTESSAMELLRTMMDDLEYDYLCLTSPAYHFDTGRMVSTVVKPILNDTMPPQCNVLFRSQVTQVSCSEQFKGVPTRIQIHDAYSPLAKMSYEHSDSQVMKFGLISYYPSSKYTNFDPNSSEPAYFRELSSEMLASERHTGPWVHEINFPRWFGYLNDKYGSRDSAPDEFSVERTLKERFFRRQLLMAKYMGRAVQVVSAFNPYVTPGFPGVVFDGEDVQFNFAGHVDTVTHNISPSDMSTTVTMHFVRSLEEAASVEIPSPVLEVMAVTHVQDRLSNIYHTILGDGDPTLTGSPYTDSQGANAIAFETLQDLFTGPGADSASPQNNIRKAYQFQRRNIVTFDQYCQFHGLYQETGVGPDGDTTPISLVSPHLERSWENVSSFITEDRHPLGEYSGIPQEKLAEILTRRSLPNGSVVSTGHVSAAGIPPSSLALLPIDGSLRETLLAIAKREFSRYIYKGQNAKDNLS